MFVLLIILMGAVAMFLVIETASNWVVYGGLVSESELDAYLSKHLDGATLNRFNRNILQMPLYAAISNSLLSKWHVESLGVVPRWSPWTKRLDIKQAQLKKDYINSL